MKKTLLLLFILLNISINAFAIDILDEETQGAVSEDIISKEAIPEDIIPEDTVSQDITPEDTVSEKPVSEDADHEDSAPQEIASEDVGPKNTLSDSVSRINAIEDDEDKIKEWAKNSKFEYYVIIDKKNCSATVYNKEGDEKGTYEIGVGTEIGDDFNDTSGLLGKPKNTTPAGEYTLIENIYNKSAYGDLTLSLGGKANKSKTNKKVVAMHKVPKFRQKDRLHKFNDGNLANNRMSHGCINFLDKDFKEFTKYIHGGLSVYILPEEADNHLMLKKNSKGEYELAQTKYKG